jgi:hypothetical protein
MIDFRTLSVGPSIFEFPKWKIGLETVLKRQAPLGKRVEDAAVRVRPA